MTEDNTSFRLRLEGKSMVVAYLLWWFLGWAGIHRFYLGRIKSGVTQLLLFVGGWVTVALLVGIPLLVVWFIWWALDAYFTYRMVKTENDLQGVKEATVSLSRTTGGGNEIDRLERLYDLYAKGGITKNEYETRKAALLGEPASLHYRP